ncbi:tat (twin-arginine translocation) pathway signal sequence [Streptomyces sp. SPB074]|nr:tat (twin-arginine translocation) pathway signal sequence [Streptomyces sp. SPB074]
MCGATAHGVHRFARETGIMGELYTENQYRNPEGNPYYWDQVVLDAVLAEPLIDLYLDTDVREAEASGPPGDRTVRSCTGWMTGSERRITFRARQFLDCTGDGLLGALAGARHRVGREARAEYDEPWAPEEADGALLGSTLLFHTKDLGHPVKYVAPAYAKDLSTTPLLRNRVLRTGDNGCDYWWIEWGGALDTVHDNARIRDELRAVVAGVWDHIKNSGEFPDAASLTLEWTGAVPGKREYRRFLGDHVLTQRDILAQRPFPDRVAFGGWSIDLHPVEGMYAEEPGARQRHTDGVFHIPLRSLYSANVRNLFFAGRNISASHVAFGATRVMATCATLGEAAGTAAALCVRERLTPRELAHDHLGLLRRALLRQDASVLGLADEDPANLARAARVTASSYQNALRAEPGRDGSADPETDGSADPGTDGSADPDGDGSAAHRADATASPGAGAEPYPLTRDVGLLLPVDPALDAIDLHVHGPASGPARELTVELWGTGRPENAVPATHLATTTVRVPPGGPHWVTAALPHHPAAPENVVVLVRACPGLALTLLGERTDGVLALRRRAEGDPAVNHDIPEEAAQPVLEWEARALRRRSFAFRARPATRAFAPERAAGGHQRPYGGPNLWSSARLADPAHAGEWLELEWAREQDIAEVRLVLDDDVDEYLNNLHRHRTPFAVMPELLRDYRVQARAADGSWRTLVTVRDNRRRHRVHHLPAPVRTRALRLRVDATHGAPHAHVHAFKAFAERGGAPGGPGTV